MAVYRCTATKVPKRPRSWRRRYNSSGRVRPSTETRLPKKSRRGTRSKVCVADWNGDGQPDLLVGDLAYLKPDRPEPTPEEKAKYEQIRKELEPLRERYGELAQKLYGPSQGRTKEERDKLNEDMKQVMDQMQPLQSQLPREYETHGWVWLFLRK